MWTREVVDKLTAAARALVALLKLFLDNILRFRVASETVATLRLRSTDLLSTTITTTHLHLAIIVSLLGLTTVTIVHLGKLFLVREGI